MTNGGLSIGIKNGSTYTFTNYNSNTPGIIDDFGNNVAFDSNNNVGYVSKDGGLSIGSILNINYDQNKIVYEKLSNGLYSINNLTLSVNFPLTRITGIAENPDNDNNYIRVILEDQKNNNIFGYYITWDGNDIENPTNFSQKQKTSEANSFDSNIKLENIVGKEGLNPNNQYKLIISYGNNEQNQIIVNQIKLNILSSNNSNNIFLIISLSVGLGLGIPIVFYTGYFIYKKFFKKKI